MLRTIFHALSVPTVHLLKPFRVWAWTTRSTFIRGLILEFMTVVDTTMVAMNIQNGALLLNYRAFGEGNFFFGKTLMIVDHAAADEALVKPQSRGSLFMGLPIVAYAPPALMTNAAPTAVSQPARGALRSFMDEHTYTQAVKNPDLETLRERAAGMLQEWREDPKRDTLWSVRGTVTRLLTLFIADVELGKAESDQITTTYIKQFAIYSAFAYFAPFVLGLIGADEKTRSEVYLPMARHGIDAIKVDMILFAGMFSVGTITMRCVQNTKEFDIDYAALSPKERVAFVVESARMWPTVSTAHRIVEEPEEVKVGNRTIQVRPGQEIAYPFVCINRDPSVFSDPASFKLDRSNEEIAAILSWSKGTHACPARDLSVLTTVLMLDTLSEAVGDLRTHTISNVEF